MAEDLATPSTAAEEGEATFPTLLAAAYYETASFTAPQVKGVKGTGKGFQASTFTKSSLIITCARTGGTAHEAAEAFTKRTLREKGPISGREAAPTVAGQNLPAPAVLRAAEVSG